MQTPVSPRLIRLPDVMIMTGLGKTTIYKLIKASTFPAPIKLGQRSVAWSVDAVDTWCKSVTTPTPQPS